MKSIITSILIFTSLHLAAQQQPKGFHLTRPINMATILAKKPTTAFGFSSVSEARTIINDIMDVVGMQQNFQVMSTPQVDNAAAVMYNGQRYILYNPSFINQLDNAANDKWASISVLGHEIGHHLLGHTMDGTGSQIPKELAADQFSGMVLHKMGASLQQAQLAMRLIGSDRASATHPAEQDRLVAIAKGWNSTGVENNERDYPVVVNTPTNNTRNYPNQGNGNYPNNGSSYPNNGNSYPNNRTNRSTYPTNNDDRNIGRNSYPGNSRQRNSGVNVPIVYDILINGARNQQFFINAQNNVVMLRGYQTVVVARISATNRSNYPYIIYDDQQQILIDRRGNLLLEDGRKVGYITRHA